MLDNVSCKNSTPILPGHNTFASFIFYSIYHDMLDELAYAKGGKGGGDMVPSKSIFNGDLNIRRGQRGSARDYGSLIHLFGCKSI